MPVRIATFNLENLDDRPDLDPPLSARIRLLRPQLLRLSADVLCLQEVNGQHPEDGGPRRLLALDRLLEDTPYAGFQRAATTALGGQGVADRHNLVTLSRWPIAGHEQLRHELVPPPGYRSVTAEPDEAEAQPVEWDRPILKTAIELPGGASLHIVNLHLRAPLAALIAGQKEGAFAWRSVGGWAEGFFLATVKRCGQALETRLLVDRIFDSDPGALIAVCGDFNAEEQEMPLRIIRGDVEDTGNGHLAYRALVPLERTLPASQRFSVLHHGHKQMLDHILASRALMAYYRQVEVHNEALGDELVAYATVSHSPESYHAPVVAEFALPDG
jgi:endonuclease/exonuclease/phosphatase family metal-dependent hydrolase